MEYYIKKTGDSFEVAKFDDGSEQPLEVYKVYLYKPQSCACMAWRSGKTRPCKHIGMVQEFVNQGEPSPFSLIR